MIELEPFAERHLPGLAALLEDAEVGRFTRLPVPAPSEFPATWLARYEEGRRDGTREAFAIVDAGAFLGLALAVSIDRETRRAELGYAVMPAARGRGVATEALRQLTDWARRELGGFRLELVITADNAASQRVAELSGYSRENAETWSRLPSDPRPGPRPPR